MPKHASRRQVLQTLALCAAASLVPMAPPVAAQALRFAPPEGRWLYRRSLTRELFDGKKVVATRGFDVSFAAVEGGYRIDGAQVSSEMDVPPALAAMAEIERNRVESGVFPLFLDSAGLIRDEILGEVEDEDPAHKEALARAIGMIAAQGPSDEEKTEAVTFVRSISEVAGQIRSRLPANLFTPPPEPIRSEQEVRFPEGEPGLLVTEFGGFVDPECGVMREAYRRIETHIEGTVQHTREDWTFSRI